MKAQITSIGQPTMSRNGDAVYYRIKLFLANGEFVMTDIVPQYRNWRYWKPVLEAGTGTWISGVKLLYAGKVDADSQVKITKSPVPKAPKTMKQIFKEEIRSIKQITVQTSLF